MIWLFKSSLLFTSMLSELRSALDGTVLNPLKAARDTHILIQETPAKYAYFGKLRWVYEYHEGNSPLLWFYGPLTVYDGDRSRWMTEEKKEKCIHHYVCSDNTIWRVGSFSPNSLRYIRIPFDPEGFKNRFPSHKLKQLFPPVSTTSV